MLQLSLLRELSGDTRGTLNILSSLSVLSIELLNKKVQQECSDTAHCLYLNGHRLYPILRTLNLDRSPNISYN